MPAPYNSVLTKPDNLIDNYQLTIQESILDIFLIYCVENTDFISKSFKKDKIIVNFQLSIVNSAKPRKRQFAELSMIKKGETK